MKQMRPDQRTTHDDPAGQHGPRASVGGGFVRLDVLTRPRTICLSCATRTRGDDDLQTFAPTPVTCPPENYYREHLPHAVTFRVFESGLEFRVGVRVGVG